MFQRPQDKSPIMPTILLDTKGSGEIIFWLWHLGLSISCIGPASFTFSRFELVLNSPSPPAHHLHLMLSVTLGWTQQTERWLDKPFTNPWNTERKATLCHCWLRRTWQSGLNTVSSHGFFLCSFRGHWWTLKSEIMNLMDSWSYSVFLLGCIDKSFWPSQ